MIRIFMLIPAAVFCFPLICCGEAGYYMEREVTMNAGSEQADKITSRAWVTEDKGRFEMDKLVLIERLDRGRKYVLNTAQKTFHEARLDQASPSANFTYQKTSKRLILGDRQASEVIMHVDSGGQGLVEQSGYYVNDIGVELGPFYKMLLKFPSQRYSYQPFQELKGFPILFKGVLPSDQMPFESEFKSLEQLDISNDKFEIPADFKAVQE